MKTTGLQDTVLGGPFTGFVSSLFLTVCKFPSQTSTVVYIHSRACACSCCDKVNREGHGDTQEHNIPIPATRTGFLQPCKTNVCVPACRCESLNLWGGVDNTGYEVMTLQDGGARMLCQMHVIEHKHGKSATQIYVAQLSEMPVSTKKK